MFLALLAVTFVVSFLVSAIAAAIFKKPINAILQRIIADAISEAWVRYIRFAIFVVGISSGVRVWDLERYINPQTANGANVLELTRDRWVLEVYRSVIESLQGIAWLLLVFFAFALIAFVIIRVFELKRATPSQSDGSRES
jgi:hypothetical protein